MKHFLSIVTLLLLTGCMSVALKYIGADETKMKIKSLDVGGKQVLFLPMHHLGKQEFYADVRRKVDSLHQQGYVILYEGISEFSRQLTKDEEELYGRKFRKIIGFSMKNQRMKLSKKLENRYVHQPSAEALGITKKDIHADVEMDVLIDAYQQRYGTVTLTPCDYNTSFEEEYPCGKKSRENIDRLSQLRNERLMNLVKQNLDKKLAILYGSQHYTDLVQMEK